MKHLFIILILLITFSWGQEYPENCGSGEEMKVDENVGIGTTRPDIVASDTLSAKILNVYNGSGQARVVAQGTTGGLSDWVDLGGATDAKWMAFFVDAGVGKFLSLVDNGTAAKSNNILVMDLITGAVGIGAPTPNARLSLGNSWAAQKFLLYDNNNYYKYGLGAENGDMQVFCPQNADLRFGYVPTGTGTGFVERLGMDKDGTFNFGGTGFTRSHFIFENDSANTTEAMVVFDQNSASAPYFEFIGGSIHTGRTADDEYIKIIVGGNTRYVRLYKD